MPADQIGFHTCWPRNSSSMVAVPRSGKLLLLPQRPGTERRVPGGLGREEGFLNSKGGVEAEGNSSFKPLQGEGILPAELPPKRKVSPPKMQVLFSPTQEICTTDGYALALFGICLWSKRNRPRKWSDKWFYGNIVPRRWLSPSKRGFLCNSNTGATSSNARGNRRSRV